MAKLVIASIDADYGATASINTAFDDIETAFENTLSRDGTAPNAMSAEIDMGSNTINNLSAPPNNNSAARLQDILDNAGTLTSATAVTTTTSDTAGYFEASNVEAALEEIGSVTVDTVAAMKLTSPSANGIIYTRGYYSVGDGADARYLVKTPQAFDGYGDHELANGNIAVLQVSGAVNVKWFGADTALADNSASIQAALDFIIAKGGGSLFIPQGTWLLTAGLTYDLSTITSNDTSRLIIRGEGRGSLLKMINTADQLFRYIGHNSYPQGFLTMRDFSMIGNNTVGSSGIHMSGGAAYNVFDNMTIEAFDYNLDFSDVDQTEFYSCRIKWGLHGGIFRGATAGVTGHNNINFYGCSVQNNTNFGLQIIDFAGVSFFGGTYSTNGIASDTSTFGVQLKLTILTSATATFFGSLLEGNRGLGDVAMVLDTFDGATINIKGCSFLRTANFGDHNIYVGGTASVKTVNLSGNVHKSLASYTPSAARPYIKILDPSTTNVNDDGTSYYQETLEAPNLSGWTAQSVAWTPELWDDSNSGSEGQTYGGNNEGNYFRMGNAVFISGRLDMAGLGTLTTTEAANIGNLPYQPIVPGSIDIGYTFGLGLSAAYSISSLLNASQKKFSLWSQDTTAGGSSLTIAELSAAGDIMFSGWYFTDDAV